MELCNTNRAMPAARLTALHPPAHRQNRPCAQEGDTTPEHKQVDTTTCKGKTQTTPHTHPHADTHIPHMNSLLVCSGAERDSTVWFTATTSTTSATARSENTPTQRGLSPPPIYLLGDTRLFHVRACSANTLPSLPV